MSATKFHLREGEGARGKAATSLLWGLSSRFGCMDFFWGGGNEGEAEKAPSSAGTPCPVSRAALPGKRFGGGVSIVTPQLRGSLNGKLTPAATAPSSRRSLLLLATLRGLASSFVAYLFSFPSSFLFKGQFLAKRAALDNKNGTNAAYSSRETS